MVKEREMVRLKERELGGHRTVSHRHERMVARRRRQLEHVPGSRAWLAKLMDLDYAPNVDRMVLLRMERSARSLGLPLEDVELLGQDEQIAQEFVENVAEGSHEEYMETIKWDDLREIRSRRASHG